MLQLDCSTNHQTFTFSHKAILVVFAVDDIPTLRMLSIKAVTVFIENYT